MLTRKDILNATYFESIYHRGLGLARGGKVRNLEWKPGDKTIHADVEESKDYQPSAVLNAEDRLASIVCTCPSYQPRYGLCEHLVAMLLVFLDTWHPDPDQPRLVPQGAQGAISAVANRMVIPVVPDFVASSRRLMQSPNGSWIQAEESSSEVSLDEQDEPDSGVDLNESMNAAVSPGMATGSQETGSLHTRRRTSSALTGSSRSAQDAPILPIAPPVSRLLSAFSDEPVSESAPVAAETSEETSDEGVGGSADETSEDTVSTLVRIVPVLHGQSRVIRSLTVSFRIGTPGAMYVLRDLNAFADAASSRKPLRFGRKFTWHPGRSRFTPSSDALRDLILDIVADQRAFARLFGDLKTMPTGDRRLMLPPSRVRRFIEVLSTTTAHGEAPAIDAEWGVGTARLQVTREPFRLPARMDAVPGGFRITADQHWCNLKLLAEDGTLVTDGQTLYHLEGEQASALRHLRTAFTGSQDRLQAAFPSEPEAQELLIPDRMSMSLFSHVVPALERHGLLQLDPDVDAKVHREPLLVKVWLDRNTDRLDAWISFHYGVFHADMSPSTFPLRTPDGRFLIRDADAEGRVPELLVRCGFEAGPRGYSLKGEDQMAEFVCEGLAQLFPLAEIHATDAFTGMRLRRHVRFAARLTFGDNDLLSFSLYPENAEPADLAAILSAYRLKRKYARLRDGSFMAVSGAEVAGLAAMLDSLDLDEDNLSADGTTLPAYRALYLDRIARETGLSLTETAPVRSMIQDIRSPSEIPFQDPPGMGAVMRDYQRTGTSWLATLARYGCGGILADDMGLGKTLQVLALLLSHRIAETASDSPVPHQPSMVIAPTSLVYNWQEEALRFTPDLRVVVISGHADERKLQRQEISDADLVVTSYALVRRDAEEYADIRFRYCIADEAQHIKNPTSVNARAVKSIQAGTRFALTGTPIENSLTELWSIFDFVMPGYLHSHARFVRRVEAPVMRDGDAAAMADLTRHIAPFILRRMKKEVLTELPDKIETRMVCDMTDAQRDLYAAHLLRARGELDEAVGEGGFERNRILILALLTRLRQICCHPGVFIENYDGDSGKLDALLEIAEEAVAGGHRILLFSQFTRMLNLIRPHLEAKGLSCLYLDGSTPTGERLGLVKSFNAGTGDVFLISLKAGGSGLNLTGADTVIHFDPWWNPAVEDQATDRAYRMGQQNAVQVIRLVTAGTIEEKIDLLQRRKRDLTDQVIQPGETFLTRLSESEIRDLFL